MAVTHRARDSGRLTTYGDIRRRTQAIARPGRRAGRGPGDRGARNQVRLAPSPAAGGRGRAGVVGVARLRPPLRGHGRGAGRPTDRPVVAGRRPRLRRHPPGDPTRGAPGRRHGAAAGGAGADPARHAPGHRAGAPILGRLRRGRIQRLHRPHRTAPCPASTSACPGRPCSRRPAWRRGRWACRRCGSCVVPARPEPRRPRAAQSRSPTPACAPAPAGRPSPSSWPATGSTRTTSRPRGSTSSCSWPPWPSPSGSSQSEALPLWPVPALLESEAWARLKRFGTTVLQLPYGSIDNEQPETGTSAGYRVAMLVVLLAVVGASAVTHQITPAALCLVFFGLALTGRTSLRMLWVLIAVLVWAWLSWEAHTYWSGHLSRSSARPARSARPSTRRWAPGCRAPPSGGPSSDADGSACGVTWLAAMAGWWALWRRGRSMWTMVIVAVGPGVRRRRRQLRWRGRAPGPAVQPRPSRGPDRQPHRLRPAAPGIGRPAGGHRRRSSSPSSRSTGSATRTSRRSPPGTWPRPPGSTCTSRTGRASTSPTETSRSTTPRTGSYKLVEFGGLLTMTGKTLAAHLPVTRKPDLRLHHPEPGQLRDRLPRVPAGLARRLRHPLLRTGDVHVVYRNSTALVLRIEKSRPDPAPEAGGRCPTGSRWSR